MGHKFNHSLQSTTTDFRVLIAYNHKGKIESYHRFSLLQNSTLRFRKQMVHIKSIRSFIISKRPIQRFILHNQEPEAKSKSLKDYGFQVEKQIPFVVYYFK
ncbi:unnamed protein product [Lactuca virosa]|uniref:Uncharacterized protein n=1 Tax=Lactuca virosa TaxID=75947 RepID=A0AAU9LU83_9ASTR|nr:unnamed protein product [Lactuca virosa]